METITIEFLNNKLYSTNPGWGNTEEILCRSSSSNIHRISESVFRFTEYNFLPNDGSELDGHYTFYVNYKTFEYVVYQSSYYGSFTYTTPSKNKNWLKPKGVTKKIIESVIAHKLLGSYYYDGDQINHKGKNLFEQFNKTTNYTEWFYSKRCLICDYRGYVWSDLKPELRSEKCLEALRKLDPSFKLKIVEKINIGKLTKWKIRENYGKYQKNGIQYTLPIQVILNTGETLKINLHRYLTGLYYSWYNFTLNGEKLIEFDQNYKGKPSDLIKMLPDLLKSL